MWGHKRLMGLVSALAGLVLSGVASAASGPVVVATVAMVGEPLAVIAGDRAKVSSLMGEGVDPHLYRPTRSDIARMTKADLIIQVGANLEAQLREPLAQLADKVTVVALADHLPAERLNQLADGSGHHDPHIWMDPQLWREALAAGVAALVKHDPEGAAGYQARAEAYFAKLDLLSARAQQAMATIPANARALVTAHDAFGYFGQRFGLEVHGIQGISTESEAGLQAVEQLVGFLVQRKVPAVFVESSVSERNVRALVDGAAARGWPVAIGGQLYSDAMGAPGTYHGTYLGMIDHNVVTIVRALGGQAPAEGLLDQVAAR